MKNVISVNTMRNADFNTIKSGVPSKLLMERAGNALLNCYHYKGKTAVVCGTGNNAGDGYVLAYLLKINGHQCTVFLTDKKFSPDGEFFYKRCLDSGVNVEYVSENTEFNKFDTIVDCIFGTGFHGKVDKTAATLIEKINACGAYIISADINSGLNGDNGMAEIAVKSNLTVSIGTLKPGHFLNQAKDYIGKVINADIGIPVPEGYGLVEASDFGEYVSKRKNFSHKGTYGYVAIAGGSVHYAGAVKLASLGAAAMRSGSGVVKLIVPDKIYGALSKEITECTVFTVNSDETGAMEPQFDKIKESLKNIKAVAVGCGWGNGKNNLQILKFILEEYNMPIVIDADGLNALAEDVSVLKNTKCSVVITPHVKEFARLTKQTTEEIINNPIVSAENFAAQNNVIVVLKGPTTVVTDGEKTYLCDRGCAGMATAGSGDVLSGILVGVLGQNMNNLLLSVAYATFINGLAGELAQKEFTDICMTSKDTVTKIPNAVIYCRDYKDGD